MHQRVDDRGDHVAMAAQHRVLRRLVDELDGFVEDVALGEGLGDLELDAELLGEGLDRLHAAHVGARVDLRDREVPEEERDAVGLLLSGPAQRTLAVVARPVAAATRLA